MGALEVFYADLGEGELFPPLALTILFLAGDGSLGEAEGSFWKSLGSLSAEII